MSEWLVSWLLAWSFLSCLRALAPRFFLYSSGRHRVFFTGWTLVWEYKPRNRQSGTSFLPEFSSPLYYPHPSASIPPPYRLMMTTRRRLPNGLGNLVMVEGVGTTSVEEGGSSQWRTYCQNLQDVLVASWYKCGVILFAIGQVACLSFLIYNLGCTLLQSNLLPLLLLPHDMVKQGLQTIRQTQPPTTMATPPSLHIATAMRPLLPGVGNSYSLFQVWLAVLMALAFHELGHALAARAEGLSVQYVGLYLAVVVPGAYVVVDERLKHLPPLSQLRVYCAGVWHNLLLCLLIATAFRLHLGSLFYLQGQGVVLASIGSSSLFKDVLLPGSAIVGLQDTATPDTTSLSTLLSMMEEDGQQRLQRWEAWRANYTTTAEDDGLAALLASQDPVLWEEAGLLQGGAFCVPEGGGSVSSSSSSSTTATAALQTCCAAAVLKGEDNSENNCFLLHQLTHPHAPLATCLPGREMAVHTNAVRPQSPVPPGCQSIYRPLTLPPITLLKLQLSSGRIIVYEGTASQLTQGLQLSDHLPRPWLTTLLLGHQGLAASLAPKFLSLLAALVDVSFSIGVLNLVPALHLDGCHAMDQFLRVYLPSRWRLSSYRHHMLLFGTLLLYSNVVFAALSLLETQVVPKTSP